MPPPDTDLAARVRAGMAFLDQRLGVGWESAINVKRLDMDHPQCCILGQLDSAGCCGSLVIMREPWFGRVLEWLFGIAGFYRVMRRLGWRCDDAIVHGFCPQSCSVQDYAALTAEWRAQLAARRAAKETALKE